MHKIDGWLLYDYRGNNPIARQVTGLHGYLTRRFFYWIPEKGEPTKLVHQIEEHQFTSLKGKQRLYASHGELHKQLKEMLQGVKVVAMETSALPSISYVDGGTLELIENLGIKIVSSAEMIEHKRKPLTPSQIESHVQAATHLDHLLHRAWLFIRDHVENHSPLTEKDVQEFLLCQFAACGMVTDSPPICAAGKHSADPHHEPTDRLIQLDDLVLIDLWAKFDQSDAIYADLCKVGVVGKPTDRQLEIFSIVAEAREAALAAIKPGISGWEVDQICRDVIEKRGYGPFFTHRTGHNISTQCHGLGTHLDNFETHDTRPLLPGTCFSVEPGIYLPGEFGIRLECDVILEQEIEVTGNPQKDIWSMPSLS